jgi:hypothetical protein
MIGGERPIGWAASRRTSQRDLDIPGSAGDIQIFAFERCSDLAEQLCAELAPVCELSPRSQRHLMIIASTMIRHSRSKRRLTPGQCPLTSSGAWARSNSTSPRQHVSRSMDSSPFFVVSTLPGCGSPCSSCSTPPRSLISRARLTGRNPVRRADTPGLPLDDVSAAERRTGPGQLVRVVQ